jgi:hypothetical protein
VIREIAEKVRLAIKRQQLARKMKKIREKSKKTMKYFRKKLQIFFINALFCGRKRFQAFLGLFYAKFFEFEEFTIEPFLGGSIQPQHIVKEYIFYSEKKRMRSSLMQEARFRCPSTTHCCILLKKCLVWITGLNLEHHN